jgi:hypothetical protein
MVRVFIAQMTRCQRCTLHSCLDSIKQSAYAELASDLEINKAIEHLRARDLDSATQILKTFEKKDTKVRSNKPFQSNLLSGRFCRR